MKGASTIAAEVSVPERVLIASDPRRTGVMGATSMAMVVRGLIERDAGDELRLTKEGRVVIEALLAGKG